MNAVRRESDSLLEAALLAPLIFVGLVLPLDFIAEIDGYSKYLRPGQLPKVYAWAWCLYGLGGIAVGLVLVLLGVLFRRRWAALVRVGALAVGWVVLVTSVFHALKLWLLSVGATQASVAVGGSQRIALAVAVLAAIPVSLWLSKRLGLLVRPAAMGALMGLVLMAFAPFQTWPQSARDKASQPAPDPRAPTIILLTEDALSYGHTSLAGYARDTTPALEAFARSATSFSRFYTNGNFTAPGISSILTGTRPWTHRALHAHAQGLPAVADQSLVACLYRAGYQTCAVATNSIAAPFQNGTGDWMTKVYGGLANQTDVRLQSFLGTRSPAAFHVTALNSFTVFCRLTDRVLVSTGVWKLNSHYDAEAPLAAAKRLVAGRDPSRPLFLWVHFFAPHSPYATPAPFLGRYDQGPLHRSEFNSDPPAQFAASAEAAFPGAYVGRYDESVAYADHALGQMLDWLKEQGLFEPSMILVSSDHGESFSHGYGSHDGPLLSEELLHVPLVIKMPHQTVGTLSEGIAEQIDLAPTILKAAGLAPSPIMEGTALGGAPDDRKEACSMNFEQANRFDALDRGSVALIGKRWKYVHYFGPLRYPLMPSLHDQLFDLTADPEERHDCTASEPAIAARMLGTITRDLDVHAGRLPD